MYFLIRKVPGTGVPRTFKIKNFQSLSITQDQVTEAVTIPGVGSADNYALKVTGNTQRVVISFTIMGDTATGSTVSGIDTASWSTDTSLLTTMNIVSYLTTTFENKEIDQQGYYYLYLGHDGGAAYPDAYGGGAEFTNPTTKSTADSWHTSSTDVKYKGFIDHLQIDAAASSPIVWNCTISFLVGKNPT